MKPGTSVVEEVTLYSVEIEGRGGNSVRNEYFLSNQDALLASAIDGCNHTPIPVRALKFSDDTYGIVSEFRISIPPGEEQIAAFKKRVLEGLTPMQKFMLSQG
ncbi:TPA: hypothetical protein DEP94_00600 [Candidatus Nomurabacteria bacterium]|nr:hypothetical protein [Candidatus Nomurabacteria bacterium]